MAHQTTNATSHKPYQHADKPTRCPSVHASHAPHRYFMIRFQYDAAKYFWYLFFIGLSLTFFSYYGMMSVVVSPNLQIAVVSTSSFYAIWFIFAGFMITKPQMPPWWSWYYWLDPVSYLL